jgi:F-type H+-transporting ATPase subunit delta
MAEKLTLARPYAKAAFLFARDENKFAQWENFLNSFAALMQDKRVQSKVSDPNETHAEILEFLRQMLDLQSGSSEMNFVQLIVSAKKLLLLNEIAHGFHLLHENFLQVQEIEVVSFMPLPAMQKQKLLTALEKKLQRKLKVTFSEDINLLGGVLVRAGDLVIDGSARRQIEKLAHRLIT